MLCSFAGKLSNTRENVTVKCTSGFGFYKVSKKMCFVLIESLGLSHVHCAVCRISKANLAPRMVPCGHSGLALSVMICHEACHDMWRQTGTIWNHFGLPKSTAGQLCRFANLSSQCKLWKKPSAVIGCVPTKSEGSKGSLALQMKQKKSGNGIKKLLYRNVWEWQVSRLMLQMFLILRNLTPADSPSKSSKSSKGSKTCHGNAPQATSTSVLLLQAGLWVQVHAIRFHRSGTWAGVKLRQPQKAKIINKSV